MSRSVEGKTKYEVDKINEKITKIIFVNKNVREFLLAQNI